MAFKSSRNRNVVRVSAAAAVAPVITYLAGSLAHELITTTQGNDAGTVAMAEAAQHSIRGLIEPELIAEGALIVGGLGFAYANARRKNGAQDMAARQLSDFDAATILSAVGSLPLQNDGGFSPAHVQERGIGELPVYPE